MLTLVSFFIPFFLFIVGVCLGSFLNVLADRLPNDRSILGRSKCDHCGKTLGAIDLIPIFSYLLTRGRCRYCHKHYSYQYLLVELLTGILFVGTFLFITPNNLVNIIYALVILSCLIAIFFADLRYGIIPDKILVIALVSSFVWLLFYPQLFLNHFVAGSVAFLFFLIIFFLTRGRGMGFGDVKLAFILGIFLGLPNVLLALYVAFLTGGAVGIILILWKKKRLKSEIAFGPFLIFGTLITFYFAPQILPRVMDLLS